MNRTGDSLPEKRENVMAGRERESNFELLRMTAGIAVIILHFNFFPGGGGALETASGLNYYLLMILEIISAPAVNIFILISGYFSCNSNRVKTARLLELLLQTICFSLIINIISGIAHHSLNLHTLAGALIPANYFVILYIGLMLLSPFINKLISALSLRGFSRLILISFLLFAVYATLVDTLKEITGKDWNGLSPIGLEGSMNGYTIVNFILVYLIGAWLKKSGWVEQGKFRTSALLPVLVGCVAIIFAWRKLLPNTAWTYCNPILIIEACVIFLLFGKIRLQSKIVNTLAPASFVCYLLNLQILYRLHPDAIGEKNTLVMIVMLTAIAAGIYLVSWVVMLCWNIFYGKTLGKMMKRIPDISIE